MKAAFSIVTNGDSALDIRFDAEPSEALSRHITALAQAIEAQQWQGVRELIPAYQCLTVCYDPLLCDSPQLSARLETLANRHPEASASKSDQSRLIRIPVCYAPEFAPDMQAVSAHTGLSAEQIIARHTAPRYLVHMLGFTPGFLYLGGLDPLLHCPRKATPELRVPAGSVGIGGSQTGIYPQATPGGWQIIGRTPVALFRPGHNRPFVAEPLDRIEFYPIDSEAFERFDPDTFSTRPQEPAA
ncbi:5-oxoprolinase subunit PxpB [Microbulbifer thermotolerans]|uniref:5-oxoprolinase subunit PxpB n=2 Tax=Microbulbifer thermotolerans TaxID=252514 RepID=A0A143HIS0_MICTH|nr:5-oxoprolinase subunit PxpB [Microbulbifer thermotolerans]AMX01615.1 hypothetical protein A3224_02600 [Microbulbifer thermotolerans]MCX2802637.1 5-oxoprolinase subunit PxpB [Microbulbifer thermotolerans]